MFVLWNSIDSDSVVNTHLDVQLEDQTITPDYAPQSCKSNQV